MRGAWQTTRESHQAGAKLQIDAELFDLHDKLGGVGAGEAGLDADLADGCDGA